MGADIYIKKIQNQPEGYFRDPYNPSSIMWVYGLSWWIDIGPRLNEETGILPVEDIKWLLEQIQQPFPERMKIPEHTTGVKFRPMTEKEKGFFEKRQKGFVKFLEKPLN